MRQGLTFGAAGLLSAFRYLANKQGERDDA
jgi:hypothetical protein